MTLESVFLVCNYGVLPAWLLLVVAPKAPFTQRVVHAMWIPLALAAVYAVGFATAPAPPEGASFFSLGGVQLFLSQPHGALVGWIHYLAFDLFVGAWQVRDADRRGIRHAFVIPCLLATLMLGPIGLGMYAILRFATGNGPGLDEGS
jgi:hypothetical protein